MCVPRAGCGRCRSESLHGVRCSSTYFVPCGALVCFVSESFALQRNQSNGTCCCLRRRTSVPILLLTSAKHAQQHAFMCVSARRVEAPIACFTPVHRTTRLCAASAKFSMGWGTSAYLRCENHQAGCCSKFRCNTGRFSPLLFVSFPSLSLTSPSHRTSCIASNLEKE